MWLCYTFDWASVVIVLLSMTSLSVAIVVFDRYWLRNHYFTRTVRKYQLLFEEPLTSALFIEYPNQRFRFQVSAFCEPCLFNPFAQMQLGQALVVFGIVTVFACVDSDYMHYWSPVWAGALVRQMIFL